MRLCASSRSRPKCGEWKFRPELICGQDSRNREMRQRSSKLLSYSAANGLCRPGPQAGGHDEIHFGIPGYRNTGNPLAGIILPVRSVNFVHFQKGTSSMSLKIALSAALVMAATQAPAEQASSLDAAVSAPTRTPANVARDQY